MMIGLLEGLTWLEFEDCAFLERDNFGIQGKLEKKNGKYVFGYNEDMFDEIKLESKTLSEAEDEIIERIKKLNNLHKELRVNEKYEFKGYGWHELAECLGIELNGEWTDLELKEIIINYLSSNKEFMKVVKLYIQKLVDDEYTGQYGEVFKGFLNIENDIVFTQMLSTNLMHMWS